MTQPQTDAQAALAAAALVISKIPTEHTARFMTGETLRMANAFLAWLNKPGAVTVERHADADERLVPNEDFRSPSQAPTERIDPAAVERAAQVRAYGHTLDPINKTPSGKYACRCGETWPCSRRDRFDGIDKLARWATERTELHGGR